MRKEMLIFNCPWCLPPDGENKAARGGQYPLPGFDFTDGICSYHKLQQIINTRNLPAYLESKGIPLSQLIRDCVETEAAKKEVR